MPQPLHVRNIFLNSRVNGIIKLLNYILRLPPICHHDKQELHKCHFGDCPPCGQVCDEVHENCLHICPSRCHSAVLVKIESKKASMPWEQTAPQFELKALPCPDCVMPVAVTCFGKFVEN